MAIFGVCYSPYRRGAARPPRPVAEADVAGDFDVMKAHGVTHVRTYAVGSPSDGNVHNVPAAAQRGIKVALGVWADRDSGAIHASIDQALEQARSHPGTLSHLVIGNEVDRDDDKHTTPEQIAAAMAYARQRMAALGLTGAFPVTSCFTGTVLQNASSPWRGVVGDCESCVFLTVYPWYAGSPNVVPDDIDPNMQWSWNNGLNQVAALGKAVVIAEIGWPSDGGYLTSVANEATNYAVTKKWVGGANTLGRAFDTYWFEMFDEPWKGAEGPQGIHWGLCDAGGTPKFDFRS